MGQLKLRGERYVRGLLELIDRLPGGPLAMAEVGSFAGESAELFAASGKFAAVHCVDHWRVALECGGIRCTGVEAEARFDAVLVKYACLRKHKLSSREASCIFEMGSLDFAYVDAGHDYESVLDDITLWRPKVKPGGWLAGHDFTLKFSGVIRAVTDTFSQPIMVFQDSSWLVRV